MTISDNAADMQKNEVRVIKINKEAVLEMLWETFMQIGYEKLNLPADSDDVIFRMKVDDSMESLIFYAYVLQKNSIANADYIDEYVSKKVATTTDSLYSLPAGGKHYVSIFLD